MPARLPTRAADLCARLRCPPGFRLAQFLRLVWLPRIDAEVEGRIIGIAARRIEVHLELMHTKPRGRRG